MSKLETDLEKAAVNLAQNTYGLQVHKLVNYVGVPDRLFLKENPPGILYVEFKKEGEKPRAIQRFQIQELRDKGFRAEVIDNMPDFVKLLEEHFE